MAIKLDGGDLRVERVENGIKYVRAGLLADTKEEVIAMGTDASQVQGMGASEVLVMGSTAWTMNMELGQLGSDNTWKW